MDQLLAIRPATFEDVIGIVYVQATTWLASYPNAEHDISEADIRAINWQAKIPGWQHMIKSRDYRVWVAAVTPEVYGFACLDKTGRLPQVYALYVLPEHQRRGIGGQLLQEVIATVGQPGLSLQVAVYNDASQKFYQRHGFVHNGRGGGYRLPGGKTIPTVEMVLSAA